MADFGRRSKAALRWFVTAGIVVYAISDWGAPTTAKQAAELSDEPGAPAEIRVLSISDADVNPGDAIVVKIAGADDRQPITAKIAKRPADVIVRDHGSIVVRVPSNAPLGKAAMRIVQGDKRSKSWDLHIRASNHRKLIARLLGGLALFVLGLDLLATGLRGLTGQRIRGLLGRLTQSPPKALGVGMLVGIITQLTTSAAALAVSLVEARLLALGSAVSILVGAQLGASITGAVLPVALARESLLVIAVGVLWRRMSTGRRARAVADLLLGTGLMLYGVHLLQTSVEPLVSDPKLLPYLDQLRADDVTSLLACALTGALLALALQGPGPVYVLVVGLVHVTGALPLPNALAILTGTNIGAAAAMAAIAWQSGSTTRPLAAPHLLFGVVATAVGLLILPATTYVATATVGDAGMPVQLAVSFGVAQVITVLGWLAALPRLSATAAQRRLGVRDETNARPDALAVSAHQVLAETLTKLERAAAIAADTSCSGDRAQSSDAEDTLVATRRSLERQYALLGDIAGSAAVDKAASAIVATLQLQRVVEQLVHLAELSVERGLRLSAAEQQRLRTMEALARESFAALIDACESGEPPDLEAAGSREIRMNQLEAEGRSTALAAPTRTKDSASIRLGISELVDAYEHVGNHLYRIAKALGGDGEDLV